MDADRDVFRCRYHDGLQYYLRNQGEEDLHRAYEMGRDAMAAGLGILDVTAWHHEALGSLLTRQQDAECCMATEGAGRFLAKCIKATEAAGRFLAECLSPFEMSHRGTREAALALRRMNEALENESKRIGQALHNEAGQLLASVHIGLADLAPELSAQERRKLDLIVLALKQTEDSLRDLSHELRPMILENLGLLPALRNLSEKLARRNQLSISIQAKSSTRMPAAIEAAVYRSVQEALNNVVRHARARNVRIRLHCGSRWACCLVQDDGVGLRHARGGASKRQDGAGLGLIGIRERLGALGGSFRIVSRPQLGTRFLLVVPVR
ncbi:MAG: hypothetical protein JO133_14215 [Burkholderiaceae bacterium]|nr:hypothetical protein [Burkholderiaceae bacterium]